MSVNVRTRPETGKLYFDFRYRGKRCKEYTALDDNRANRQRVNKVAERIAAEGALNTFDYRTYFPTSKRAAEFDGPPRNAIIRQGRELPTLRDFTGQWLQEMEVSWRTATRRTNVGTINRHILPAFGERKVSDISKADVLQFRASLAKIPGRGGNVSLSNKTINHTVGMLLTILTEAADRFEFSKPVPHLKRLKVPKTDVHPFALDEVQTILATVRPDYRQYFAVRFFTGMRTGEIHGLRWENVDFQRKLILVRETFSKGERDYTKTHGSQRDIVMSSIAEAALRHQQKATGKHEWVFCTRKGTPLDTKNVCNRVWYPLLRHLDYKQRRPYQCRHTCATLWLAAGENPEWIARQLGPANTEMLFRVYSRYVPNLTRRDGSAFENMVRTAVRGAGDSTGDSA